MKILKGITAQIMIFLRFYDWGYINLWFFDPRYFDCSIITLRYYLTLRYYDMRFYDRGILRLFDPRYCDQTIEYNVN